MNLHLFVFLLFICCGYAMLRGGPPEKAAGILQFAAYAIGLPVHLTARKLGYVTLEMSTFGIDLALLLALAVLAHKSTRFWPLWLAAWQFATVLAHLAKLMNPEILPAGYAIQAELWAYPMLCMTVAGTVRHRLRLAAGNPDPAWKRAFETGAEVAGRQAIQSRKN